MTTMATLPLNGAAQGRNMPFEHPDAARIEAPPECDLAGDRKRLTAAERKTQILEEARRQFARHGFEGARTRDIARVIGISETLVYRHFATKHALYRAVLRRSIRDQNANHDLVGLQEISPRGLVTNLRTYFEVVTGNGPAHIREGFRLLLASVADDAGFASRIYRRSNRIMNARVQQALDMAHAAGDLVGKPLDARNTSMFIEHIGTMANALSALGEQAMPYSGDRHQIVADAVWFCCRGLGFSEAAIRRHLAPEQPETA